jgi:hypothetical protein
MIDVRTGIRKTYRWQVGASRLRQASGRNPNRMIFRASSAQSLRAIGFHSGPRPIGGVLGGRSLVGITSAAAVSGTRHTSRTASMSGDDGRAIEGPGQPITHHAGQRNILAPIILACKGIIITIRALQCAQQGEFALGRHPGTAGTGKRDRRSAASAARSARRISPPGNGASQAGPARQASHTTTPGVAVS